MSQDIAHQYDPRWYGRVFLWLVSLWFLLILLPILLADRPFNDDVVRQATGAYGWNANGRHLSNLLMRVLALGQSRLVDLSPLPQLLALPLLAIGCLSWLKRIRIRSAQVAVLVAFPIGAQPFFLENLSYQFDAGFMALAVSTALIAATHFRLGVAGLATTTLALIACFSLYQPAINVFLVACMLVLIRDHIDGERLQKTAVQLIAAVLLASLIGLLHRTLTAQSVSAWVQDHSQILPWRQWPLGIWRNIQAFLSFQLAAFHPRTQMLWTLLAILSALPGLICIRTVVPTNRARNVWALIPWLLLPIMLLLASLGPMLLLSEPVVLPRVLIGTGMLIAAVFALGAFCIDRSPEPATRGQTMAKHAWYTANGLFVLIAMTHAYAYGNALKAQLQFEHRIVNELRDDLWHLQQTAAVSAVRLDGSMTQAAQTYRIGQNFPFIGRMIWPYLHHSDDFSLAFMSQHLPESLRLVPRRETPGWSITNCPDVVIDRPDYRIRVFEHTAIVQLRADAEWHCSH